MKIDINQQLSNSDGTLAIEDDTKAPVTLKKILVQVLLAPAGENSEKIKKFSLYRDLIKTKVGFVSWSAEEVALIKKTVLDTHATLVAGQVHEMVEREYEPVVLVEPPQERMAHDL